MASFARTSLVSCLVFMVLAAPLCAAAENRKILSVVSVNPTVQCINVLNNPQIDGNNVNVNVLGVQVPLNLVLNLLLPILGQGATGSGATGALFFQSAQSNNNCAATYTDNNSGTQCFSAVPVNIPALGGAGFLTPCTAN